MDFDSRPKHYKTNQDIYEPYKVINAWNLNFNLGNVIKYISRLGKKENNSILSDLVKIRQYIDFEIERIDIDDSKRSNEKN